MHNSRGVTPNESRRNSFQRHGGSHRTTTVEQELAMFRRGRSDVVSQAERSGVTELVPGSTTDARLVEQVRQGDREAFGELVVRYERKLQRVLRRLVHDSEVARDLAQETFLKVYRNLAQYDASRRFAPWLFRVAVNLAVDWLRRRRPAYRLSQLAQGDSNAMEVVDP